MANFQTRLWRWRILGGIRYDLDLNLIYVLKLMDMSFYHLVLIVLIKLGMTN